MKIILGIFLVGFLFLAGCQIGCPDKECQECEICIEPIVCEECDKCPEEKAQINSYLSSWGPLESTNKRVTFDLVLYNYGDIEIKDVIVTCHIETFSGKRLWTGKENVGNIGSLSENIKLLTFEMGTFTLNMDDSLGFCYVSNCRNCEILDLKIPEVKKRFV